MDPFARTDTLAPEVLDAIAARFETRGRHALFSKMLAEYLDAMHLGPRAAVLDLGCGTGLAARAIARQPGFAGTVHGIDLSPRLVAIAAGLAGDDGLADRTYFEVGNARHVAFAEGTFDAVVAHTLVSHVDDPPAVLREAARVVKPGGVIGIFDGDYGSLTFDHRDPDRVKAYDEALVAAVVTNPRVMRQMPRLLRQAGLDLVASFSYVLSEAGRADFWLSGVEAYRRLLPRSGRMTEAEADGWAAALRADSDAGVFFGSCTYYAYVARR